MGGKKKCKNDQGKFVGAESQQRQQAQQRGQQGGQEGGHKQRGQEGGQQGGHAQPGQAGGQQGGHKQRGQEGGQQGGHKQRGQEGGQQGGHAQPGQAGGQQGGHKQRGQEGGQQGGYQQRGQQGGQQGGYQQRGQEGGQQGGYQQRGQQGGQQGGYQQRGQEGGQQGGHKQRGQEGGQQGGYQQRGQQGGQQGGYQQRGQEGGQQGGHKQRGQEGGQQGGYQQRGQGGQQGGYQQRGQEGGQQGGYKQPLSGHIPRGTLGRRGTLEVNYLNVDLTNMPNVAYHYDVIITPERPKKFYRQAFENFRVKHLNGAMIAFDGRKSCYSVEKVQNATGEVEVIDNNSRTLRYTVAMKDTENFEVDLGSLRRYHTEKVYDKPMRALQCLEVVLASPCHSTAIRVGRSFFKKDDNQNVELGDGYKALIGLYQSFVLGDTPFINVDVSHKSFPIAMPLTEYLSRYILRSNITQSTSLRQYYTFLMAFLKGVNVVYEPPKSFGNLPRVYKVTDLSQSPATQHKFEVDGKLISIEKYFQGRGYNLKYPNLECLRVGPPEKNIYLPVELCRIEEGQVLNRKDYAKQVSEMIKYAATPPHARKTKILELINYFKHNLDPIISRFGIKLGGSFITVDFRQLQAPKLEYKNNKIATPFNGSWRMENYHFLEAKQKAFKWTILYSGDSRNQLQYSKLCDFMTMVCRLCKTVNMFLEPNAQITAFKDERHLDDIFKNLSKENCDLAFVILPNRGASYDVVKQKAELQHGILTQCIKQVNVDRRLSDQLVNNILLKVNSKLNGINHKLQNYPLVNVMYLGADVTHPSPDQTYIPSVVGVAASHDKYGCSYNMQYRLQASGGGGAREEIDNMDSIVAEHLRTYKEHQNSYPEHIIYYRDGVSDGQFMKIKNIELKAISRACAKLNIKPHICCIVVVKRHHTRFFPTGAGSHNVEPGTVVDRTIVHPNEMQFFMVSHQAIRGTARPTRYNVIENTKNLDIDLLQQLTYNLCHMFPRCNRAVSYPAPAYLAHLAAARGRVYISGRPLVKSPKEEYMKRQIVPHFMKSNPMYFV